MKRWLVGLVVAGSMVALVPGAALAAKSTPAGGCPDGYGRLTIKQAVKVTGASTADVTAIDKNGDTYVCVVQLPDATLPTNHNVIDNNTPA